MKKVCLFPLLVIISILSLAQVNLESLVKPGAKMIYAVVAGEQKYDFIITIKALTPALFFDWQMTDPINTSGTITHTAKAMIIASTMNNYFSAGEKTLDDNTISVWLSKNVYAGLIRNGKSVLMQMNTGDEPKNMGMYTENKVLKIIVNGEKETVEEEIVRELNNEGRPTANEDYFTFYRSAKLPVILRMQNGFYIVLKEIKTK